MVNPSDFERYIRDRINEVFNNDFSYGWPFSSGYGSRAITEGGSTDQGSNNALTTSTRRFRMDFNEKPDCYELEAELPGMKKENIQVYTEGDMLTIAAENFEEKKDENDKRHIYERNYGRVQRSLRMPENCSMDNPKAKYENGLLYLIFKKTEPTSRKLIQL